MIFLKSGALETKVLSLSVLQLSKRQRNTPHGSQQNTFCVIELLPSLLTWPVHAHEFISKLIILDTFFMLCIMAETNRLLSAGARSPQLITAKEQTILVTPHKLINNFN